MPAHARPTPPHLGHGGLEEEIVDGSRVGVGGRERDGHNGGAGRTALKAKLHRQSVLLVGGHLWDAFESEGSTTGNGGVEERWRDRGWEGI